MRVLLPTVEVRSQDDEVDPHGSMIGFDSDATGDGSPALVADSMPAAENGDIDMDDDNVVSDTRSASDTGSAANAAIRAGDDWKYSVRVNVASGTRSSIVLSTSSQGSKDVAVQRPVTETEAAENARKRLHDAATVRILHEPGDSGKSVYDCLYGGERGSPMTMKTVQLGDPHQLTAADVEVLQAEQGFDVDMDEADADEESLLSKDALSVSHATGEEVRKTPPLLSDFTTDHLNPGADKMLKPVHLFDTLPDIHEYFSHRGFSEDARILNQVLTNVRTADLALCHPLVLLH